MADLTWQDAILDQTTSRRDPETGVCFAGWGDVRLPPTPVLERRAFLIRGGALVLERWDEAQDGNLYEAMRDTPGDLRVEAYYSEGHRGFSWRVSLLEAGDPDSYCSTSSGLSLDHALAWVIAAAERHHAERLAEDLRFVGGLA